MPRDVQELTAQGTANYKVYGMNTEWYLYRVSAFSYPTPIAGLTPFDAPGDLAHSSGKAIARMRGKIEREEDVRVDDSIGKDIESSAENNEGPEHGVQRMLISSTPPVRYHLVCTTGAHVDLEPCRKFARSLKPRSPPPPGR